MSNRNDERLSIRPDKLKKLNLDPPLDNSPGAILDLLGSLANIVFNAPAEEIWTTPDNPNYAESLTMLPENGNTHKEAIPRLRILRWTGAMMSLLRFEAWNILDLIIWLGEGKRPSTVSASNTPVHNSVNRMSTQSAAVVRPVRMDALLDSINEFIDFRASVQTAHQGLVDQVEAVLAGIDILDNEIAALNTELEQVRQEMTEQGLENQLKAAQAEEANAGRIFNEIASQLNNANESNKRINTRLAKEQSALKSLDDDLRADQDKLHKLKDQIVESPEQLKKEKKNAHAEAESSEQQLMAAIEALELVNQLEQAQRSVRDYGATFNEIIANWRNCMSEVKHCDGKMREVTAKEDRAAQEFDAEKRKLDEERVRWEAELEAARAGLDRQLDVENTALEQHRGLEAETQRISERSEELRHKTKDWIHQRRATELKLADLQELSAKLSNALNDADQRTIDWTETQDEWLRNVELQILDRQQRLGLLVEETIGQHGN